MHGETMMQHSNDVRNMVKSVKVTAGEGENETQYGQQVKKYWDAISGDELDPKLVHEARMEEMRYFRKMGVYRRAWKSECLKATGKPPIGIK